MSGKRDSVGKFAPSTSSKEHLGTLVEEEEEEEDIVLDITLTSSPTDDVPAPVNEPVATPVPSVPVRHRPASLNLRPLSLVSASTLLISNTDLPTPSPSPNAINARAGLRALTLGGMPIPELTDAKSKRQSAIFNPAPTATAPRLVPLNTSVIQVPPPTVSKVARRSSLSYFAGSPDIPSHGLPTPEMTPVSDRRYSAASTDSDLSQRSSRGSRPLSISEQHFLFQAHQTLVQRISDLERALSARPHSRPQSSASDASSQSETVSDEMLQLIADLKAERDELKKDVDGWRSRLTDSEQQMTLLFRRVENERREAWVARERVGLMEIEKRSLEKTLQEKTVWGEESWQKYQISQTALEKTQEERDAFRLEAEEAASARQECKILKALLESETRRREEVEKDLESVLATPTPRAFEFQHKHTSTASRTMMFAKRGGLGFRSIDSASSFTDVESNGSVDHGSAKLRAVEEVDEEDSRDETMSDYEDSGLAGYEDEDDDDHYAFHESFSGSSLGSVDDFAASTASAVNTSADSVPPLSSSRSSTASPAPPASPPQQAHGRHRSLSQPWTFPQDNGGHAATFGGVTEIDRFFNCLEDVDNSPPLVSLGSGKTLFSQALEAEDDELPPFVLPSGFGIEINSPEVEKTVLDVVVEEEEEEEAAEEESVLFADEDFVGEEVEGGIIFTFTLPPGFEEPEVEVQSPDVSHDGSLSQDSSFDEAHSHSMSSMSSSSIVTPSFIPRLVSKRPLASALPLSSTPVKTSRSMECFTTPPPATFTPIKRGVSPVDLHRSPTSSPSPFAPSKLSQPSFIPQPRRTEPIKSASTKVVSGKGLTSPKQRPSMYDSSFLLTSSLMY